MKTPMKTVRADTSGNHQIIHVETALGIVNIHVGLADLKGRNVVTVEMIPSNCVGEYKVQRIGNRLRQCLKATN